ncbi:DUF3488 domain-containing protein [Luteimonas gilva]|uniref:DUF3488 domain-containing protein n=1 Tax=Luteimonas gilva TaxID=2572684 RepID=A0A4V5ZQG1_9GAMM|nr:DUF3488 and transglutaminase-like domain-containing protein [Luteimonas gilva]TKR32923.1 DUF3488 domain-containing protein [Luteimonas gilva]
MALDNASRRWALLAMAACLLPLLLQLPGQVGAAIAGLAVVVAALSWRRPMPGWLRFLLALAVVALVLKMSRFSIGRDTGCALLAAMLAIKPSETAALRDARSLVGFALFGPFATFLLDQGPASMGLGLIGVTLALLALRRFADAEADLPASAGSAWRELLSVWRLIAIGLPLALAAFWLFPRIGSPLWGVPERALARPGLSERMSPGEWIDLLADDAPALRVHFFGPMPPAEQMYWRGPVLWDFDGRTWTQPQWLRGLPAAETRRSGAAWDYELEFEPTDRRQLVALELPNAAPEGARLSGDYGLYAERVLSTVTRWRMRSTPPAAFEPELKALLRQAALRLPQGYNPRTVALARQWRAEAGSNDAAIVQRALDWIRKDFAYTLDTPLLGRHSVDEFLFDQRAGFCEHFSSSFVVLMRAAGIPARVVTGYVGGYRNPFGDYWVVRRMDAHAWAEVWLPQRGWVRVDPTAAVAPERIYDTLEDRAAGDFAGLRQVLDAGDWLRRGWNELVLGFDATRQQRMLQPLGIDKLDAGDLIALFAALAALALGWMVWLIAHSERERDPLLRAWRRLGARYARFGLQREPHEPALDWAERVFRRRPQEGALRTLAQRFAESRYAVADAAGRRELIRALRAHRPASLRGNDR